MTTFSPAVFYGTHVDLLQMQLSRDQQAWLTQHDPTLRADVLLFLSCGIQTVAHLMREAVELFS